MKRYSFRQLCIDTFYAVTLGLMLIAVLISATAARADDIAGDITVPYANAEGYSTTRVIINETDKPIDLPNAFPGFGAKFTLQPYQTHRTPAWPREGLGVETVTVPAGLRAYSEISDPNGVIVRIGNLQRYEQLEQFHFQDLRTRDGYNSFVFVFSKEASAATVQSYIGDELINEGDVGVPLGSGSRGMIVPGADRAVVTVGYRQFGAYKVGPIYAFALVSRAPRGELLLIEPKRLP